MTSPPSQKPTISLSLNSFVRRTERTEVLKSLIAVHHGSLKRRGRSRNWTLNLPIENRKHLIKALYTAEEPSWLWLAKQLAECTLRSTPESLLAYAQQHPDITLQQLMAETDCSPREGRRTLDQLEWE